MAPIYQAAAVRAGEGPDLTASDHYSSRILPDLAAERLIAFRHACLYPTMPRQPQMDGSNL